MCTLAVSARVAQPASCLHAGGLCLSFVVGEATGELGGFSESQLMAHYILNFVEAAHSLCVVEVSPQWFSLNPNRGGSLVLWAHLTPFGPLLLALEPTFYCSSLSALPEAVLVNGVGVERSWHTLRGPLIKILERPSKNMSAVTCTPMCISHIVYVLMSSLPN